MGNEYDQIYTYDVLAELARQHGQALLRQQAIGHQQALGHHQAVSLEHAYTRQRESEYPRRGDAGVETQKVVGALIAIEVVLVLCSLVVVTWILTSNVSLT
jgi:hypothetical protein